MDQKTNQDNETIKTLLRHLIACYGLLKVRNALESVVYQEGVTREVQQEGNLFTDARSTHRTAASRPSAYDLSVNRGLK